VVDDPSLLEPRLLSTGHPARKCGCAFRLNEQSPLTAAESMPDGAIADLIAGSREIVVYGDHALPDYAQAFEWGVAEAQSALDLMAMRGAAVLV
jgi:hypothetical protein